MPDTLRQDASNLAAAAAHYKQVLAADPEQWDSLYLYGTALLQLGRFHEAIDVFGRAAKLRPGIPDVYNNLGVACQGIGQVDVAVKAYRQAIDFDPDFDLAHVNLARSLESAGRFAEAEISLRRAIRIKPAEASYRLQLANVISRQNKWPEAARVLQEALELHPQNVDLQMNLAAALIHQERLDEAVCVYRAVLSERPDYAEAQSSLAFVLERQGHLSDALAAAERAVELCVPTLPKFHNNLGTVLRSLHRLDDACRAFRPGDRDSTRASHWPNSTWGRRCSWPVDTSKAGRAIAQHARVAGAVAPGPPTTEWDGRPIPGRRLLVYADQGLGDTVQFARFLPLCKQRSEAQVIFRCQPPLRRLLAGEGGADEICTSDDELPTFDRHIPLASLPGLFGLTIEQVGLDVPYLRSQVCLCRRESVSGSVEERLSVASGWSGRGIPGKAAMSCDRVRWKSFSLYSTSPGFAFSVCSAIQSVAPQLGDVDGSGSVGRRGSVAGGLCRHGRRLGSTRLADHGRHGDRSSRRSARAPRLDHALPYAGLAVALGPLRFPLVSHDATLPPAEVGRLGFGYRADPVPTANRLIVAAAVRSNEPHSCQSVAHPTRLRLWTQSRIPRLRRLAERSRTGCRGLAPAFISRGGCGLMRPPFQQLPLK